MPRSALCSLKGPYDLGIHAWLLLAHPIALSAESDTRLKTGRGASPVGCGSSSLRALGHWSGGYRVASFHQNGQRRSATGRETLASLQESDTTSSSTGLCRRTSNIAAVSLIWVSDGRLASLPRCCIA